MITAWLHQALSLQRYKSNGSVSNKAVTSKNSPVPNAPSSIGKAKQAKRPEQGSERGQYTSRESGGEDVKAPIESGKVGIDGEIGRGGIPL